MPVQTVLGTVDAGALGLITPHEHVFLDLTGFFDEHPVPGCPNPAQDKVTIERLGALYRDPYALRDNLILDDYECQKAELLAFKKAGGGAVVDATMAGIGRDVRRLKQMSEETGLHIIAGTGYYVGATHPPELEHLTEKEIAAQMLRELNTGIQDTGIRAGFIGEIGISEHFDESERKVLRASALAQVESGVGIEVHINPWTTGGLEAVDILLRSGVPPNRICICHVDVQNDRTYIDQLLAMGVYIEFDNFGKQYYVNPNVRNSGYGCFVSDVERVGLLAELIGKGYGRQLLLSCDVCLKILLHRYGGWGYDHILTNVVLMMREAGIAEGDIEMAIRENPAQFLEPGA